MTPAPLLTPAFDAYLVPARRRPQVWRILAGAVVIFVVYLAWVVGMLGVAGLVLGWDEAMMMAGRLASAVDPGPALLLLLSFGGMALGAFAAAQLVHRRRPGEMLGRAPVVLRDFIVSALVVVVVYAVVSIPWALAWDAAPNLDFSLWIKLLPIALAGVLLQTLAEELTFRGYLMSQLAARFRSPLIWLVLPAAVFGALHYDPRANGTNTWTVIAAVTLFGLVSADLTRRTGSLGAAWGTHFANNTLALLVLGTQGGISGLALRVTPYAAADAEVGKLILSDILTLVLVWLVLIRILRR